MYEQRQAETTTPTVDGSTQVEPRLQEFGSNQERLAELGLGATSTLALAESEGGDGDGVTAPAYTVRVVVDEAFDEHRMRDQILRGPPFLFSEADLARLRTENDDLFYLNDKKTPGVRATPAQIQKWGKAGATISIPVRGSVVADLLRFKLGPVLDDARQGLPLSLANPLVDLLIRSFAGEVAATEQLAGLAASDKGVAAAIRRVADSPQGRTSPTIQLTAARLLTDRQVQADQQVGPPGPEREQAMTEIRERIGLATQLSTNVDRTQASGVNQSAALMYRRLGDERSATEREMISRMYESSPTERAGITPISRSSPDRTSMSATTPETRALQEFYAENPMIQPRTEIGARADATEPQVSVEVRELGNKRRTVDGTRTSTRVRTPTGGSIEGNPTGLVQSRQVGGAANLLQQWNLWMTANAKMLQLAQKLATLGRLEAADRRATTWGRPPRAAELLRIRQSLDAAVGPTPPDTIRAEVAEARRKLALLEEASLAFYGM